MAQQACHCLDLTVAAILVQVPYSGFAMMTRVAACIAISRIIRTIAFLLTVLPNPRTGCYNRRFPAVPDTWWGFWKVGFGQMRGMGGCNDLIIRYATNVSLISTV